MDKEIKIQCNSDAINIDKIKFQKMLFLYNALENGWNIRKKRDYYIFNKKHGGEKEIYLDKYITTFMKDNFEIEKILN